MSLPRQSEARVLPLPPCTRKRWRGKTDKLQPLWHGVLYIQDPKQPPRLSWAACAVPWPQAGLGNSPAALPGTDLPWSHTGITHLTPGDQHLADSNVARAPAATRIWAYMLKDNYVPTNSGLKTEKWGGIFRSAQLRLYWGQWDFFLRVLSENWIRSVPKCFCKSDLCGKQRGTMFSLPLMAA